jgi:pimeloyl-ACP methyl ester carboxylesterase
MNAESGAMSPFKIEVPQADLEDLHRRLDSARWPDDVPGDEPDWSRGAPTSYTRALAEHWRHTFDWRAAEATLNAHPSFATQIDGQAVHFVHARSPEPDALPLIVLHGYPGSFAEFMHVIGPLADPRAHGGDPADAFHVVVPSLPGFGLSTPLSSAGWELGRSTDAMAELMGRLGYDRYGAQGADIGAGVAGRLAALHPDHVVGVHLASDRGSLGMAGEMFPVPDDLTEDERAVIDQARAAWTAERGYLELQSHRPETIAVAVTDSPVGQLAWIAEKYQTWTNPTRSPEDSVDRDQLLTIVSLYWFTRSGASAARFLYEAAHGHLDWVAGSSVPTGWAVFNSDPVMRRVMDPQRQIEHWSEYSEGGHFPAMEEPGLFVDDVRSFFRKVRG